MENRNHSIIIPGTNDVALKMLVKDFRKAVKAGSDPYAPSALQKTYNLLTSKNLTKNVNFYLSNGHIYLFPESGKGFSEDMKTLELIRSSL